MMRNYRAISCLEPIPELTGTSAIEGTWQWFVNRVVIAIKEHLVKGILNGSEPRIWQKCDRDGNPFWQVYDPVTDCSDSFSSERDVMVWIEERYHH